MYITLNIATTSIRLLSVSGRRVKEWGSTPLEAGLIRDGLILQPKAVGAAIDSLFKSTKVPKEQVIISVSGLPFTHRILNLPRMKPELVEEAIELAARREIPLPPRWSWILPTRLTASAGFALTHTFKEA